MFFGSVTSCGFKSHCKKRPQPIQVGVAGTTWQAGSRTLGLRIMFRDRSQARMVQKLMRPPVRNISGGLQAVRDTESGLQVPCPG
jgi:hypothetical protein